MMRGLILGLAAGAALMVSADDKEAASMKAKEELIAADRAFAKATAERRLDGWMDFYTADAVRITPIGGKATFGTKAIRELDSKMFEDKSTNLVWEPTDGGMWADGKHGFTTGKAKIVGKNAEGKEEVKFLGAYVTIWRKEASGWKVILDTGAERKSDD
jgi:ketosteroid isomerase-like protein